MIKRDGSTGPEGRQLRSAPTEKVVTTGRHNHAAEFAGVFVEPAHERTVGALGILVEIGAGRETGRDGSGLALRGVVVEHRDHGDFLAGRAVAGVAEFVAIIAALVGHVVSVGPAALLQTTSEVVVQPKDVRNARVAELSEEMRVGVARESAAGFAECAGFVVAVRINEPHALAEHVVRVLHFLERGEIVVVAVGVGHADAGRKSACTG